MRDTFAHPDEARGNASSGLSASGRAGSAGAGVDVAAITDHTAPPSPIAAGEAELLARLRAGDDAAFTLLVVTNTPRLLAVARRVSRNEADAEDAVQEAFASAFKAIHTFDGRSALSTWLHRIVVNAALSRARKAGTRRESSIEDLLPRFEGGRHESRPSPWRDVTPDGGIDVETKEAVRAAIAELPEEFRAVIVLKDIEGLQSAEIAAALGISDALVRQRVHRGRQALIKLLTPTLKEAST
jgi:RNA polymerase sigma-70 factor (ECF subfamily)